MARLIQDIWASLRALPVWVQVWVFVILVPVNCLAILFLQEPFGRAVAAMAVGGMLPNVFFMIRDRGFGKVMSISHVIFWIPLLFLLLGMVTSFLPMSQTFSAYIVVLLLVDAVSIGFDIPDSWKWYQGDRRVAGK